MDIATLAKQLKELQKREGNPLSFSALAQVAPPIAQFINHFSATQDFMLNDVSIELKTNKKNAKKSSVTIQGQSPWHSTFPLVFRFVITAVEKQFDTLVSLTIEQQPLADMDWLQLNPLSMTLAAPETQNRQTTLQGSARLFDNTLSIAVDPNDKNNHFSLTASLSQLNFSTLAEHLLTELSLPTDLPDFSFTDTQFHCTPSTKSFSFKATSYDDWVLPLGITGLQINDIRCEVKRTVKASSSDHSSLTGQLIGNADIAGVSFDLCFAFPGDYHFTASVPKLSLSAIIQDLCGSDALMGFPAPSSVLNVTMDNIRIDAQPTSQAFSVQGTCLFGEIHLVVDQNKARWEFLCTIRPAERWQFSDIDHRLHSLDGLNFADSALVLSNAHQTPSTLLELPRGMQQSKGLSFIADLAASELQLDHLLGLKQLQINALIGMHPSDLLLTATIDGEFTLSDNIALGNMGLRLRPDANNLAIGVQGQVIAYLDESELLFIGTLEVHQLERRATFAATMLDKWQEPFGIKGLAIDALAIEIAVGIVQPPAVITPKVGFAGRIKIGSFAGDAVVKMDTVTSSKSMISAHFKRLYLREIIQTFCNPQVIQAIPVDIQSTLLNIDLTKVALQVVPQTTQIGELTYEIGFAFQGTLDIAGINAQFVFKLDYSKGFAIRAEMDTINIDNVLLITGSGKQSHPMMAINLLLGTKVDAKIAAMVQLLGLSTETLINISDSGFNFLVTGTIFDLFTANIQATSGSLQQGSEFYLKVTMQNDLMAYLREQASITIKAGCDSAIRNLDRAQSDLERSQREVQRLHGEVNRVRNVIRQKRHQQSQTLTHAQRDVKVAHDKFDHIKDDLSDMRQTISRERRRDTVSLHNARHEVSQAQRHVNDLQRKIDSSKRRIKTLKNDIARKQRWLNRSPLWRKVDRGVEYADYATEKGTEINALYTHINSIEIAKSAANLAHEATKQIVRGIEQSTNAFPVDADPRIVTLLTAKGSAKANLDITDQSVDIARNMLNNFPIDSDPRIVALFTARETATSALERAKLRIAEIKMSIGSLADVAIFITQYGLGGLLDVRSAAFEGALNTLHSGQVAMTLKLELMKTPTTLQFNFDFNDSLASAKALGEDLLQRLK